MNSVSIIVIITVCVIVFIVLLTFLLSYLSIKKTQKYDSKFDSISDEEIAGINGERKVNFILNRLIEDDEYLLSGLLIPRNIDGAEIDSVLITRKGIFCIETKNWSGSIFGGDEDKNWEQIKPNYATATYHNPVEQNNIHRDKLKNLFKNKYNVYNIVIFSNDNCILKFKSNCALKLNGFVTYYKSFEDSDNELSINDINYIHNKLQNYVATKDELRRHKEYLKRKHNH